MSQSTNEVWGHGSVFEFRLQRWFEKRHRRDFSFGDRQGHGRSSSIEDDELMTFVEANPRIEDNP